MDYKKKYEEAMFRMNKWVEGSEIIEPKEVAEFVFPELKESEDERIRKELIRAFTVSADKRDYEIYGNGITYRQVLAWLEKQGEQKANEIHPIFRVGDYIKNKNTSDKVVIEQLNVESEVYYYTSYDGAAEIHSDLSFSKQDEWELIGQLIVEQKPTDKAEPKFKAGDWVVPNNGEPRVFRVEERGWPDSIISGSFGSEYVNTFTLDKQYHLWSIQDAKDGDVLATDSDSICIFDGTVEDGKYPFAYCGLTGHYGFEVYDRKLPFTHNNDVHPATKEQRDLLFTKMKEAGVEWDGEKKELKKVESKSAWSEEDENILNDCIKCVEEGSKSSAQNQGIIDWLKSLKERYTWKPRDEQMEAFEHFVRSVGESGYASPYDNNTKLLYSLLEQLKKLKGE